MKAKRTIIFYSFLIFSLSALIIRLYYLSTNDLTIYANSQGNTYRLNLDKTRGTIYDRNLVPLVYNESVYKVAVFPSIYSKNYLYSVLKSEEFKQIEENFALGNPFTFTLDRFIEESRDVSVHLTYKRYSNNQLAQHFIGYCTNDLSKGVTGIEKCYDSLLSSFNGTLSLGFPIDAMGRSLSGAEVNIYDTTGKSDGGICLTIDSEIQKISEKAASKINKGSVLICDVNNGEILAGVSLPRYYPDDISQSILHDDSSLINRNLSAYNIGSTYKLIVASAALSMGVAPSYTYNCTGSCEIDGTVFNCHKKEGHGYQNMKDALSNSCNPYFISLGKKIGAQRLLSFTSLFSIGEDIKIAESIKCAKGNLPDKSEIKTSGDLANISFGQGSLMATPLHIAKIISIIANGGYDINPTLIKGNVEENKKLKLYKNKAENIKIISSDVSEKIREFMVNTIENGTGRAAKPKKLSAGGKTASAETGWLLSGESIVQAWFSGFYPAQNPKYAIVVLSEGGKSGAAACAPVFKEICDNLYQKGFVN